VGQNKINEKNQKGSIPPYASENLSMIKAREVKSDSMRRLKERPTPKNANFCNHILIIYVCVPPDNVKSKKMNLRQYMQNIYFVECPQIFRIRKYFGFVQKHTLAY